MTITTYSFDSYFRREALCAKNVHARQVKRLSFKYLFVFLFVCVMSQSGYGQGNDVYKDKIAQTDDLCEKAKLVDDYIEVLLWAEEFTEEFKALVKTQLTICESTDCGEQIIWARARKIDLDLNLGRIDSVQTRIENLFQSPLLVDVRLKAYLRELYGMYNLLTGGTGEKENHFRRAVTLLEKHAPEDNKLGQNYQYLGIYFNYNSQNDSAFIFAKKALAFYKERKDTAKIISSLISCDVLYTEAGNWGTALDYLLKAKSLSEAYDAKIAIKNEIFISLAMTYETQKEFTKAIEMAEVGIENMKNLEAATMDYLSSDLWNFYLIKGRILMRTGKVEEGLHFIEKSIALGDEKKLIPSLLMTSRLFEIEAFLKLKKYDLSASRLKAVVYNMKNNNNYELYNIKVIKLVKDLYENSRLRPSRAFQSTLEAIINRVIEKNRSQYNEKELAAYQLLSLFQTFDGQVNETIASGKKISEIKDSLWSQQKNRVVNELLIDYESKEQLQEIEMHQVELKNRTMERNVLIGFSFVLLLLVIAIAMYFRQRRKNIAELESKVAFRTKELNATNKKLIQSNEELERFAYISSHDLKEPLRNILSFIGLISREKEGVGENVKTYFQYVEQNANQMYRLVEDVLEFSKLKKTEIAKRKTDVNEVVRKTRDSISEYILQENAIIEVATLPVINSDGTMLFLVFKNLIENAIKYNENERPQIQISYKEDKKFHYFLVKDNGIGIESDYQTQVFDMFKRLHGKDKYEGSGIGLAICKRIVEYLNGSISLESEIGEGSVFTFSVLKEK